MLVIALAAVAIVVGLGFAAGAKRAAVAALVLAMVIAGGFIAINPEFGKMLVQSRAILAVIIVYLLMSALFDSLMYPFVIMFSVPLAGVGGFAALRVVHEVSVADVTVPIQQMDVLTMLGFVILLGVVVNNAILVVHQALINMREYKMPTDQAVVQSVRTRTRPIVMSAMTSIFGMLPLVLMTGAGSELYRGIGSVVVGGLLFSTVFTLFVVPTLFSLMIEWRTALRHAVAGAEARTPQPVLPDLPEVGPAPRPQVQHSPES